MKRKMILKLLTLSLIAGSVLGCTSCKGSEPEPTIASLPSVSASEITESLDPEDIVPDGYYTTDQIFQKDTGITFTCPEEFRTDLTVTAENDIMLIEAKPIYLKEYAFMSVKYVEPYVVYKITNKSDSAVIWHWYHASNEDDTNLMTYNGAYDMVSSNKSTVFVGDEGDAYDDVESVQINNQFQDPATFEQIGDRLQITFDLTSIDRPDF